MKVILASASERRKELLFRLFKEFEVAVSNFDEDSVVFSGNLEEYVKALSYGKAKEISKSSMKDSLIIAADTIVSIDGKILGKPKDKQEAVNMLKMLSGKEHKVYSGITVINTNNSKIIQDAVCTTVHFSRLSDEEILSYVETDEPMDKAGAYGIQGYGGVFVEKIDGCFYNVVGLPLNRLSKIIKEIM
ncbi:Maf-like protein [Clostridium sp. 'White wine YQ']|uniref:Maf-like protein n=1 Tax=Clostridium sp. 'White wine YQ' TaxID=3027474 RepID=UPI0023666601|nr:Maf-like protein [Clostridium sp. 'White wine YQ']MDD7794889.1 Maf-like protein [Clostridium sp. 'White wine YQ']